MAISFTDLPPIMTAGAALLAAIVGVITCVVSLINRFAVQEVKSDQQEAWRRLHEIKISLDGNLDRMISLATQTGIGVGVKQERESTAAAAANLVTTAAAVAKVLDDKRAESQAVAAASGPNPPDAGPVATVAVTGPKI